MTLNGRTLIITGGFGALGRAVGLAAARQGAHVALLDRAPVPAGLPSTAGLEQALLLPGVELTDLAAVTTAFAQVASHFGHIDSLANIAGAFSWQTLDGGDLAVWAQMQQANVMTAVTCCKAVLPHLQERGGSIVNIGANAAFRAGAGMGAYTASKAAVARLTESLAEELKDAGVRVNAVLPSIIDTPANRRDMPDADHARWVRPEDLAEAILFLASDQARAITGALLPVVGRV
jgi:NAD(P)-dependent dehydrogenase (short-subunit alcohol dehydrogenase family)